MYQTGGPELFGTDEGRPERNGDAPAPFTDDSVRDTGENDTATDHRLLVPDVCLNSTLQTYKVDTTKDLVVDARAAKKLLPTVEDAKAKEGGDSEDE